MFVAFAAGRKSKRLQQLSVEQTVVGSLTLKTASGKIWWNLISY